MITAISGRKGSGKSTLSKVLLQNNYVKISFADYLKKMLSEVFSLSEEYFHNQDLKSKDLFEININEKNLNKISDYIGEKLSDSIYEMYDGSSFLSESTIIRSPRKLLQFIGTNILRHHNEDFHAIKTYEKICQNPDANYVCDDLRFPNELNYLKLASKHLNCSFNSFFIIRPGNFDISNHESEISLNYSMLDRIIINDSSQENLLNKFKFLNENYDSYNYNASEHSFLKFSNNKTNKQAIISFFVIIGFARYMFNYTDFYKKALRILSNLDIKDMSNNILYLFSESLEDFSISDHLDFPDFYYKYSDLLLEDIKLFLVDDYCNLIFSKVDMKSSYKDAFNLGISIAQESNKLDIENSVRYFIENIMLSKYI